ncbi:hypothetical protein HUN59_14905 [Curtobacterium sp. Csp2]|uniref:hypothetical protein n=1 Tax=Curtobacterium sp. Csp2 TaxID=2495430 RepID=UPI001580F6BB|nr:hypothetical protein [Curtobacterium sp. Csp2]QKS17328.1 hypothetical protein HUN59_14905 [Curtobacterium sp. Csp2]
MKLLVLAAAGLAALSLTGCAAASSSAKPTPTETSFRATGTIQVPMDLNATLPLQHDAPTIGNPCIPKSGFSDIAEGSQVVVLDENGKKVALGKLRAPTLANGPSGTAFFQSVCQLDFTVAAVPDGSKIYSVRIGNDNRGEQSYSKSDLTAGVALSLV